MTLSALPLLVIAASLAWTDEACDPAARAELERLLAIELRDIAPRVKIVLSVTSCEDGLAGLVALIDHGPERDPDRVPLDLANIEPKARMRAASLAIGESIRARLKDPPRAPARAEVTPPATTPDPRRVALRLFAVGRALLPHEAWAPGLAAGAAYAVTPWLRVAADVGWQRATSTQPLGDLRLDLFHATASLQYTDVLGPIDVAVGPAVEAGLASAEGRSERTTVGTAAERGLYARAALRGDLAYPIFGDLSVVAAVESGVALRGFVARVDDQPALGVDGFSITALLGVAYAL